MQRYLLISAVILASFLLTSCSSSPEGKFVDYCKTLTANLVDGGNISWSDSQQTESSEDEIRVDLSYTAGGNTGTSSCLYAYEDSQDGSMDGEYETSPYKVILNNREVSQTEMFRATKGAVVKAVKESADNLDKMADQTAENAREAANNAAGKARELAHDAAGKVKDVAGNMQDALDK